MLRECEAGTSSVAACASERSWVAIFSVVVQQKSNHLSMASLTWTVGEIIPSILPGPKALPTAPLVEAISMLGATGPLGVSWNLSAAATVDMLMRW